MSEERTIRTGPRKGFVVLYRSAAQDARLSLEARGLLVMMASLPDNWSYSETGLASKAGCGRQKVNRILRELIDAGYLLREQRHGEHGKFASCTYVLQEEAPAGKAKKAPLYEKPSTAQPSTVKPSTGNQALNNKEEKNKEINTPLTPQRGARTERKSKYDLAEDAKPMLKSYVGDDRELALMLVEFIGTREKLRAINSKRALAIQLETLDKLSGGDRGQKLELLKQSIGNSWKGIFPLKAGGRPAQAEPERLELVHGPGVYDL